MRISLRRKNPDDIEFGIIYGAIAIMALAAARYLPVTDSMPSCVFKAFTGMPCPTCGTTRSLVHLAHGDLRGSLLLNPAFALGMISVMLWFLYSAVKLLFNHSRICLSLSQREANIARVVVVVLFLLNWAYLGFSL